MSTNFQGELTTFNSLYSGGPIEGIASDTLFSARWAAGDARDYDDAGFFARGPEASTTSAISLKVEYPKWWETESRSWLYPIEGDLIFLVLKGWTRGNELSFNVNFDDGWTRLGDILRSTKNSIGVSPSFIDKTILDVYYKKIDTGGLSRYDTISSLYTNVQAVSSRWPGAGYFRISGQIFGYKQTTYPTQVYREAGRTDNFESIAGPSWEENHSADGFSSLVIDDITNLSQNVGSENINVWSLYNESATPNDSYDLDNALVIDIIAAANVSVVGPVYDIDDRFSTQYPDGWWMRAVSSSSPSLFIGEAPYIGYSETNPFDAYKESPGLNIGVATDWLRKTFAINGYNTESNKLFQATGRAAFTGILKLTPYTNVFPDAASLEVYKNGELVIRMTRPLQQLDNPNETVSLEIESLAFGAFEWNDNVSIGLNVKYGDDIFFEARSTKNTENTFTILTIQGYPMEYEIIMSTDLRDSGGHLMNIIRMTDFGTTYPIGGLSFTASDFGMNEITYMQIQASTAYVETEGGAAVLASQQTVSSYVNAITGEVTWKVNVFVPDPETGLLVELAEGSPLTFPEGLRPTLMVMGS